MDFLEEVELVLRADPDGLLGETGGARWAKKWGWGDHCARRGNAQAV